MDTKQKYDMTIYPVKEDPDRAKYREVGYPLLQNSAVYGFVGARGSGKTNAMQNIFCRPHPFYGGKDDDVFDEIYIFSTTMGHDSTSRYMRQMENCGDERIFTEYDDGFMDAIIEEQKKYDDKKRPRVLIIADDIAGLTQGRGGRNAKLFTNPTLGRHFDISSAFSVQKYSMLPPICRSQIEGLFIFRQNNSKEVMKMCEELGSLGDPKMVERLIYDATGNEPYQFCYMNLRDYTVWKNLDTLMWSKFNESGGYNPPYKNIGTNIGLDYEEDLNSEISEKNKI